MILLTIILAAAGTFLLRLKDPKTQQIGNVFRILAIGTLITGMLLKCIVIIDAGQVGVKKLFGNVQPDILNSGMHIINPLLDVEHIDIRTMNYTMSGVHDEGEKAGDDAIRVLTSDGLEVNMDLSVLFKVVAADAPKVVRELGTNYLDKIVRPVTRTRIRDNAVYYQAIELYSTKRDEFQQRIFKSIDQDFKARGLLLEQLLVRNIELPGPVKRSIEEKIQAEQDAQKMQFVLQKEKQEAERKRVEAQGISDYQRIINQSLTDKQLRYEMIKAYQELVKSPNSKIVVLPDQKTPVILDTK